MGFWPRASHWVADQLVTLTASTLRLTDSLRESERLKGQLEERDREVAVLMRKLQVIFSKFKEKRNKPTLCGKAAFHAKCPFPVFPFPPGAEC